VTALIAIVAALFGGLLWAGRRRRLATYSCFNQAVYDADTVCDDNSCDSYDDAEAFCSDDDRDDFGERLLERLIRIGRPRRLMHASSGRTSGPDRGVQAAEFASNTQRQRAILARLIRQRLASVV
jgi:hypothetical protein